MLIEDSFDAGLNPVWSATAVRQGSAAARAGQLWLTVRPGLPPAYSNAQIADYDYHQFQFRWRPPLRMTVTARFEGYASQNEAAQSHRAPLIVGTAGFGFWNHPFSPDVRRLPRLPQAVWFFFGSPPNDMRLASGVPGAGWKAATINARRWQFLALLPAALPGILLMRVPALYNRLWPVGQRAIGVSECLLDSALLYDTHTYTLDWRATGLCFGVDGNAVHETDLAPRGPLGFIAWIDNQYAVVTPQGRFGAGVIPVEGEQSLILDRIRIETF